MFWVIGGALEAFTTQNCMVLWMKASEIFTVPQNNTDPLGITAIGALLQGLLLFPSLVKLSSKSS